ncbi:MAG: methyltransferase domain-containing protein [Alphaproteobacteria bacterium]|nr:methyltransferase domain-containing protein [Alphaproteobacteria bacterium]
MKLADVTKNYDRLSGSYDLWSRWLVDPLTDLPALRERAVQSLGLTPGARVLDIGCGTGLNLPLLASRVGPGGRVVGLDYSPGMLEQARRRAAREGWTQVELVQGDAAELAGVGGPFDAALSTWALGIVDDLPGALRRAVEVLEPGGRLAVLDLHRVRPERGLLRWMDPLVRGALRLSGVDSREDLDPERLARRWAEGRASLREALEDVHEEINVSGSGFLLTGRKPRA